MTNQRLPYDDAATPTEMASDCAEVDRALHLGGQRHDGLVTHPVHDGSYHPGPVSDDLARVAAGLELHFD
jgi:hypothetical protein